MLNRCQNGRPSIPKPKHGAWAETNAGQFAVGLTAIEIVKVDHPTNPMDRRNVAAYQAEVARRSRLTPEELAAEVSREPPSLLSLPPEAGVAFNRNVRTAQAPSEAMTFIETAATAPIAVNSQLSSLNTLALNQAPQPTRRGTTEAGSPAQVGRIGQNPGEILALAISLEGLARHRIDVLRGANDPEAIERNKDELDLLEKLAAKLAEIAAALQDYGNNPQPLFLGRAATVVNGLADLLRGWLEGHKAEAADWLVRLPTIALATTMCSLAGANMLVATTTIAGLVGGEKALRALQGLRRTSGERDQPSQNDNG